MSTFFTLKPSDLITTFTYVLMDIFCPCFKMMDLNEELLESDSDQIAELGVQIRLDTSFKAYNPFFQQWMQLYTPSLHFCYRK